MREVFAGNLGELAGSDDHDVSWMFHCAALAGGSSIEASGFFDDLVSGIRTGGQIASTLTPLISAI